jgi:ABC-type amino acid transport substrate-binding protein
LSQFTLDAWIYFAIGLVIIVVFSHRQFNEPSWQNESNIIQRLAPSEIIGKSTYYSAYLLYLLLIVGVYVLLCFSAKAAEVLSTVIGILMERSPSAGQVGGAVGGAGGEAADSAARQVTQVFANRSVPEFPLLVSLAMGALLRFPYVQRVEQWLRGFSHWIFGIPTVQIKLLERMLGTTVDLGSLEHDLDFEKGTEAYTGRIGRYASAGASVLGGTFQKAHFKEKLATIFAFRVWVAEKRIWPTDGLAASSPTYAALKDTVLDGVAVLEKDLELLSVPALCGEAGSPVLDEAMRRELWTHRVGETDRLFKDVCSVMALFTPNSDLPDETKPTAPSLIAFLKASTQVNAVWRAQRDLTLMAITLCAVWSAVMGAAFAIGLRLVVPEAYAGDPGGSVFNEFTTARNWAVTGLLAFGLATWVAVRRRATVSRRGKWSNVFEGGVWPFGQWLAIFLRCFALVVAAYLVYYVLVTFMVPLADLPAVVSKLRGTLLFYLKEIIAFGLIAGLHAVFVAILMDAEERRFRGRSLGYVMAAHVGLLALAGLVIGVYVSRLRASGGEVLQLRMADYALWAGGVASIACWTISSAWRRTHGTAGLGVPRPARALVTSVGGALLAVCLAAQGAGAGEIRIGMRADARPFVHEESPGVFAGFLADLCREAVVVAGYPAFSEERIDARSRFDAGLDLVCDPTTLTLERAGRMDFSPIVFVANATFAEVSPPRPLDAAGLAAHPACRAAAEGGSGAVAVGMLAGTTAAANFRLASDGGWLGLGAGQAPCVVEVTSHPEGIDRLCSGEFGYYFGDADILRAYLREKPGCKALLHPTFFTYEPYALVLGSDDAAFRRAFVRALYQLHATGFVAGTYAKHFGDREPSDALDMLFLINTVPAGEPDAAEPAGSR